MKLKLFIFLVLASFIFEDGFSTPFRKISEKKIHPHMRLEKWLYENYRIDMLHLTCPKKFYFDLGFANEHKFNKLDYVKNIAKKNSAIAALNLSFFGYSKNAFQTGDIRGFCALRGKILTTKSIWDDWMKPVLIYTGQKYLKIHLMNSKNNLILVKNHLPYPVPVSVNISRFGSKKNYPLFFNSLGAHFLKKKRGKFLCLKGDKDLNMFSCNSFVVEDILNDTTGAEDAILFFTESQGIDLTVGSKFDIIPRFEKVIRESVFTVSGNRMILMGGKIMTSQHLSSVIENMTFFSVNERTQEIFTGCCHASAKKLAKTLHELGMTDAILFDGGGSSSMYVKGKYIFGGKRKVANVLLIKEKNV